MEDEGERPFYPLLLQEMCFVKRSIKERLDVAAERNGLTPQQAYVLATLRRHDGQAIKEIAAHLSISPSNSTPLCRSLEAAGLVRREQDADDRRSYHLWLTDVGRAASVALEHDTTEAFGGDDERARALQARILDGLVAYRELVGCSPDGQLGKTTVEHR